MEKEKCVHCNGTGICKKAVARYNNDGKPYVRICDYCGSGVTEVYYKKLVAGYFYQAINDPQPPVCKVCNGKGFHY